MNNCFSIYHTSWMTSGPKSNYICDNIPTKAILFFFGCSEVNSTWIITSELANQPAGKVLFTCVVYTKLNYLNCGEWYEDMIIQRSYALNLISFPSCLTTHHRIWQSNRDVYSLMSVKSEQHKCKWWATPKAYRVVRLTSMINQNFVSFSAV